MSVGTSAGGGDSTVDPAGTARHGRNPRPAGVTRRPPGGDRPRSGSRRPGDRRARRVLPGSDRVGWLCACVALIGLPTTVALAVIGAPTAAFTAAGSIGTTAAAAVTIYLRRR
jgi:hypothetical protein